MDEKTRESVKTFARILFDEEHRDHLDGIARGMGLTSDKAQFDVEWELETLIREALAESAVDEAPDEIYEKLGPNEVMVLWRDGDEVVVLLNHGSYIEFRKYDMKTLERHVAVPSDALDDMRKQLREMNEMRKQLIDMAPEEEEEHD